MVTGYDPNRCSCCGVSPKMNCVCWAGSFTDYKTGKITTNHCTPASHGR